VTRALRGHSHATRSFASPRLNRHRHRAPQGEITMSEASNTTSTTSAAREHASSLVDTVFDLGFGWAATGLKLGKEALSQSAKMLEQTAKALENLAKELEKKDAAKE
jgi:hypothetical protein